MCQFFSFVGDGHGSFRYHDWEDRQRIGVNSDPGPDSHTGIPTTARVPAERQFLWSKYEYQPLTREFTIDNGVEEHDHEAARNWVEALDFRKVIPTLKVKPILHPLKIVPPRSITKKHLEMLEDWASVRASVGDSVWASVGDSVWDSVGDSVGASVGDSVWDSVWASVWASVGDSVWASVGDSVRASVGASVWASVGDSVGASVRASVWAYCSSFVDIEYQYDFSSAIKLWELGLVPSYDEKVWRLHGGKGAKILWEGTLTTKEKRP